MNILYLFHDKSSAIPFLNTLIDTRSVDKTIGFFSYQIVPTTKTEVLIDEEGDITIYAGDLIRTNKTFDEVYLVAPCGMTLSIPKWVQHNEVVVEVDSSTNINPRSERKKHLRQDEIEAGFTWGGDEFQTRAQDLTLIVGRVAKILASKALNETLSNFEWRCADDTFHNFTPEEFLKFAIAADEFVEQKYLDSWN